MSIARVGATNTIPEAPERRIPMSYEAWLSWEGSGVQSEWVDGEAVVFMTTSIRHGRIVLFFATLLSLYLRRRPIGELFLAPNEMRLSPRVSREPDLFFVRRQRLGRVTAKRLEGPADLAIEIVSDDSVRRDRITKFEEYARSGVDEYWVFESRAGHEGFDAYALDENGRFAPLAPDAEGRLYSRTIEGFWVRPEWFRHDPLPDPVDCLSDILPDAL